MTGVAWSSTRESVPGGLRRSSRTREAKSSGSDGGLAVYLYGGYGLRLAHTCSNLLRAVTTRLPLPLMVWLSAVSVPLYYVYRIPIVGNVLRIFLPISPHPHWRWRWLDTFDWYTPKYQWKVLYPEVIRWFRACGFTDIAVFDDAIRVRGVRTVTPVPRHEERLESAVASKSQAPAPGFQRWNPQSGRSRESRSGP